MGCTAVVGHPTAERLRLRTGDQHAGLHVKRPPHKLRLAKHILYRFGIAQPCHQPVELCPRLVAHHGDAVAQYLGHAHAKPLLQHHTYDGTGLSGVI